MKRLRIIISIFCLVLIMVLNSTISLAVITDSDNGKMKFYNQYGTYDIKGYVNGELQSTTFLDGGYRTMLKVDNNEPKELYAYTSTERLVNGVEWDIECSFINNGRYVKTTYTLKNTEENAKTISLGVYADVQIAGDDNATVERFENSKGLRLYNEEKNIQFSFYGKAVAGTTDVDNLWIGKYPQHRDNYFSNNDINQIKKEDSAFTYSWVNRTIAPGAMNKYTTIIGMGEVSNAPKIELDETQESCFSQDSVVINGTISDADNYSKVTLYYVVDDGAEENLSEQTLTNNKANFALDLTSKNMSIGKHKIKLWAIDESGNPSEIIEKEIMITNLKKPTLEMSEEWSKEPVKFKITDEVNKQEDVKKYQYKIGDGQWQDTELNTEITALENTGTIKITARVVGNQDGEYSSIVSKTAKVDKDGPIISVTEKDYKVTITVTDEHSGVKETKYLFSNKKEVNKEDFLEYKGEIEYKDKTSNDDIYLHVHSIDQLGNESSYMKEYKKPVCPNIETEEKFVAKKPKYKIKDDNNQYIYQVKINDGDWQNVNLNNEYTIENPISGDNKITVRAIDALGRASSEKTIAVKYIAEDSTIAPKELPYTGLKAIVIIATICILYVIWGIYKYFKLRDVK